MPTIKDVARVAGVSTSTVSYFLNQTKYVSPELEQKIQKAMAALNYRRPHPIASSLRRKQTGHVGVIFDQLADEEAMRSLKAISDALIDCGFTLMLRNTQGDETLEARHIRDLLSRQADGLILAPVAKESLTILSELNPILPLVLLGEASHDWLAPHQRGRAVSYAIDTSSQMAVDHLVAQGHVRIGLVGSESSGQAFVRGVEQALSAHSLQIDPDLICLAPPTYRGGYDCLQKLMDQPARPTALFITASSMLTGVLNGLFELGISCPKDISLIAFGHIDWADAVQPPLTTVQGDTEQLGRVAVELLRSQMESNRNHRHADPASEERITHIATRLIERGSVARYESTIPEIVS